MEQKFYHDYFIMYSFDLWTYKNRFGVRSKAREGTFKYFEREKVKSLN